MLRLTKKEQDSVMKFSSKYISVHNEIIKVEKSIKQLEEKSSNLVKELQDCRDEEKKFMESMSEKYGPGVLNPMNLCWEKKLNENVIPK